MFAATRQIVVRQLPNHSRTRNAVSQCTYPYHEKQNPSIFNTATM
jgi:hypothetical protein